MTPRLSSETVHASTVALAGRAILILGPSGSGKSDLSLRLIDRGFTLVSDDQTLLRRADGVLIASSPATIRGKMEVRGIGIVEMDWVDDVPIALAIELAGDIERMPDDSRQRQFLGIGVPLISVDSRTASASAKAVLALDRLGLKV